MTLQEWLINNNVSAREMAARVGKHESIMSRILTGVQLPSYIVVRRVYEVTKGDVGLFSWPMPKKRASKKAA